MTDNDPLRAFRRAVYAARKEGHQCAECGHKFKPREHVWRNRVSLGKGYFGGWRQTVAPVCEKCRAVSFGKTFGKAKPCEACGRFVHDQVDSSRKHTFCSEACALKVYSAAACTAAKAARAAERGESRICAGCGGSFKPRRADARFHSAACKQRAYRQRVTASNKRTEYLLGNVTPNLSPPTTNAVGARANSHADIVVGRGCLDQGPPWKNAPVSFLLATNRRASASAVTA
jgi:hypothetical protein